jgi:serine/threonine protein kinase
MNNLSGQSLGRYHLIEKLGEGGMAVVYKAFDTRLECEVAVKVIRMERLTQEMMATTLKRFEREAKAVAQLNHPNIVNITDYGEYEGVPYLVMEYLRGGTLKQMLGKPIPYAEAARLLAPVADALQYAHEHKVIHRDVKPSNILITESGAPMLTDFGIARILDMQEGQTLTGTGVGIGTPEYMAPEQWTGDITPAVDIYSLGVVFYELVTGHKPYTADTPAAVLLKQATEPLPRPCSFIPGLPERVEQVIYKSMAKKAEERYSSMREFEGALEELKAGVNIPAYRYQRTIPPEDQTYDLVNSATFATSFTSTENKRPQEAAKPSARAGAVYYSTQHNTPKKNLTGLWVSLSALAFIVLILIIGISTNWFRGFQATPTATVAPIASSVEIRTEAPTLTSTVSRREIPTEAPTVTPTTSNQGVSIEGNTVLYIPSIEKSYEGSVNSTGPYDTLFVGIYAIGDWPHCSGSIDMIEITSLIDGRSILDENFSDAAIFTQTSNTVYIANGKAVFDNVFKDGGSQFVYRQIPQIDEPIQIRVIGQIDWWENNCGVYAGIGKSDLISSNHDADYPAIFFGFFGGGCPIQGPIVQSPNIQGFVSDNCSFTRDGAGWVQSGTPIEAILTLR